MVQVIEAVFTDGVLKPVGDVSLAEGRRVRLGVEPIDEKSVADLAASRSMALKKLLDGIERMRFYSAGQGRVA